MDETIVRKLSEFEAQWREKYEAERKQLLTVFGDAALEIEHIGGTAVDGLTSKPVIDIAVMIERREDADSFSEALASLDYTFRSLSTERHFYVKGRPREFHLSVAYADEGGFWPRQILFRDYLRTHPEARREYAQLKTELLSGDPSGETYSEGKTDFVYRILNLAGWKTGEKYSPRS